MSAVFIIFAILSSAGQNTTASEAFDSFHEQYSETAQTEVWLIVVCILTMLILSFESVQQSPELAAGSAGHRQPHNAGSGCTAAAAVLLAGLAECLPGLFLQTLQAWDQTMHDNRACRLERGC